MRVKLEEVCSNQSSNIIQRDIENLVGEYPIFGASGFIKNIDTYKQEQEYLAIVKDGAGVGRVMLLPPKSSVIGTLQYLIPKDNIIPNYLFYVISNMNLGKYANGATIPHIYFKDYKKEEFELPSFDQQHRIVAILDQVNHIISLRTQQLEQLDLLIKSRFVEMFGDNKYKNVTMKEVTSIITDGTHQPPKFQKSGIPFIFVSNITTNELTYTSEKYISEETYQELYKRTPIEIGDCLLSSVGSYGHCAIVKSDKKFLFQRHIAYLKPNKNLISSNYLQSAILSEKTQRQIDTYVKGIAQKTLNLSDIKMLVIPLPPLDLQTQFAAFVEEVERSKSTIKQSLTWLNTLKSKLMQDYFG